ncbi:MAG: hypothetical protein KAJ24_00270 [Candidatus Aenigmarchaeota archaeon]|nr:hypothetical protein [Candidatus Aenigmarchaeota archaeon]
MVSTERYSLCGGFPEDILYCDEMCVMTEGDTHTISVKKGEPPLCSYMSHEDASNSLKLGTIYPRLINRFYTLIKQEDLSAMKLNKLSDCLELTTNGTTYFRHLLLNPDTSKDLNEYELRLISQLLRPRSIAAKYIKKIRENPAKFKISHLEEIL